MDDTKLVETEISGHITKLFNDTFEPIAIPKSPPPQKKKKKKMRYAGSTLENKTKRKKKTTRHASLKDKVNLSE